MSSASRKQSDTPSTKHAPARAVNNPIVGARSDADSSLNSFEAVMQAMDAEIARSRSGNHKAPVSQSEKGKGKAKATEAEIGDIEAAMEAELKSAMDRGSDDEDADLVSGEELADYNLIKNFLESFKNQAGLSGPVSNLAGRLQPGWTLPRDQR